MFHELARALKGRDTIVLLMMHADQADPFLAPLHEHGFQAFLVRMILEREHIKCLYPHCPLEMRQQNCRLYPAYCPGALAPHQVYALALELVDGYALDAGAREGGQLEEALEPRNGAACNEEGAWHQDSIEQIEGDLAVLGEPRDLGEGGAVVGREGGEEEVYRREGIGIQVGTRLLGGESITVGSELFEEGNEYLGV